MKKRITALVLALAMVLGTTVLAAGVEKAVIIPHISPDGDAVGSCSALAEALRLAGIRWELLTCDYIPDYLRFLN